jgi:hypothetical protein
LKVRALNSSTRTGLVRAFDSVSRAADSESSVATIASPALNSSTRI